MIFGTMLISASKNLVIEWSTGSLWTSLIYLVKTGMQPESMLPVIVPTISEIAQKETPEQNPI